MGHTIFCDICGMAFVDADELIEHVETHSKKDLKGYLRGEGMNTKEIQRILGGTKKPKQELSEIPKKININENPILKMGVEGVNWL